MTVDEDNQDLIDMLDSMLPTIPDRSRIPTGWLNDVETISAINRRGDLILVPEMNDSYLVRHQEICLARGGPLAEHLFYYLGADVGCGHCSDQIWNYLSYHPEDREAYEDDDGDFDWEAIQSDLEKGNGMAPYAFSTDRSENLTCDNCRVRFHVADERDALYHANAGGSIIPAVNPRREDSEDLHGHLCGPCREWFRSSLHNGRIG